MKIPKNLPKVRASTAEETAESQRNNRLKGGMRAAMRENALEEARWAKKNGLPIDPEWMKYEGITLDDL